MSYKDHIEALRTGQSVWQVRSDRLAASEPTQEPSQASAAAPAPGVEHPRHDPLEQRGLSDEIGFDAGISFAPSPGGLLSRGRTLSANAAVRDGFEAAGIVFICVERIARAVSSVPFRVEQQKRGGTWEPTTSKEGKELGKFLKNPNVSFPWSILTWRLMQHLLLTGNAVSRHTEYLTQKGIAEILVLNPDGVTPKPDEYDIVRHYKYSVAGKGSEKIPAESITHIQLPHPTNPHWGMSPLTAAAQAVDLDVSAAKWQTHTLKNQGMPSGIVSLQEALEEQAFNARREAIRDDIQGHENAGKVLLMDNGAKYSPLSLTAEELAYLGSRKFTREEVCAIYAVPPPVAGFYESSTYNNVHNARLIFWIQTVIPYLGMIAKHYNQTFQRYYGDKVRIAPNLEGIEALAPLFRERLKVALILQKLGYTPDQINERLDLGMPMLGDAP